MRTMARNTDAYIKDNAEMIITARSAAKKEVGGDDAKSETINE